MFITLVKCGEHVWSGVFVFSEYKGRGMGDKMEPFPVPGRDPVDVSLIARQLKALASEFK